MIVGRLVCVFRAGVASVCECHRRCRSSSSLRVAVTMSLARSVSLSVSQGRLRLHPHSIAWPGTAFVFCIASHRVVSYCIACRRCCLPRNRVGLRKVDFPKCRQEIRLQRVGFEGGMKFRGSKGWHCFRLVMGCASRAKAPRMAAGWCVGDVGEAEQNNLGQPTFE